MRLRFGLLAVLIFGLFGGVLAADVPLKGTVVDLDCKPVAGIKVYAVGWHYADVEVIPEVKSWIKAAAVTADDGTYEFASLPKWKGNGGYILVAYDPGKYLGWISGKGDLNAETSTNNLEPPDGYTICALKLETYEGKVVGKDGKGVAGAKVTPVMLTQDSFDSLLAAKIEAVVKLVPATTDVDGSFQIPDVPETAKVIASVKAEGYATRQWYELGDDISLQKGTQITGRLLDKKGKPVAGMRVWVSGGGGYAYVNSAADGSYAIRGLEPGGYYVGVRHGNQLMAAVARATAAAGTNKKLAKLVMPPEVTISGQVLDADARKPISGAYVSARTASSSLPSWVSVSTVTDSKGGFRLKAVPGKGLVIVRPADSASYPPAQRDVTISSKGQSGVTIKLKKLSIAKGKVIDESGKPVAGAVVVGGLGRRVTTDADGRFQMGISLEDCSGGG